VNEAYYQAEDDLALLECSMDLASQELLDRNQQLQKAKEAAEEGRRLVERLSRVAIAMQTAQEQEDRLQIFRQAAYEVMSFDRLYILLASPDGSHFELRAMHGQESADLPERLPLSTAAGPYYQAFQTRRPVVALQDEDLATILPMAPPYQDHAAFRSKRFIITPLVVEDRVIGVTSIDNKASRRPISPSSIEPLTLLCQQFATAWEEARLYAETCAREREATQLYEITALLASTLDMDRVLDLIATKAVDLPHDGRGHHRREHDGGRGTTFTVRLPGLVVAADAKELVQGFAQGKGECDNASTGRL
jgi:GAF domain-containing protein